MSEVVKAILITAGFEYLEEYKKWMYFDGESLYQVELEEDQEGMRESELLVYEVVDGTLSDPIAFGTFILGL
jgi:hypothetical protein